MIKSQIGALKKIRWAESLGATLADLHAEFGAPEPSDGPTTDARQLFPLATSHEMGCWDGEEERAASLYNEALELAQSCADIRCIGSGLAVCQHGPHSAKWDAYREAAVAAIQEWAATEAWDQFNRHPPL